MSTSTALLAQFKMLSGRGRGVCGLFGEDAKMDAEYFCS